MQQKIKTLIGHVISSSLEIEIESPKNERYGDYATNIAIIISKLNNKPPLDTANEIASRLRDIDKGKMFASIEATPQGFINFRVNRTALEDNLIEILKKNEKYGRSNIGNQKKVLLEFVSANPTGPLHIGHGRWAVIGDCLADILKAVGYNVEKEYYVNDVGEQIEKLAASVQARMEGKDLPEGGYAGSYITDLAGTLKGKKHIKEEAMKHLLAQQKDTLKKLGVNYDKWFHESDLHKNDLVKKCIKRLEEKGLTFYEGRALWFKSSEFGDDKNRVLIKEDGQPTYFAADIAYHINKYDRGYDKIINVWGTDHHGYMARLRAAITALGYPIEKLEIIIGQLVALYRGGELVRMSKRTGEMITLEEVINEIDAPATRYFLVRNSPNTHLDFDLELAKSRSLENPVYYVSYAHARICNILKEAKKEGLAPASAGLNLLGTEPERKLMLKLLRYEDEVASSAISMHPHRLTGYAESLAQTFHNYYHQCRVISDNKELSRARLTLVKATSIVLKNVLKLLGITAPDHM
ncbi:MAG: arginine--tRNA ligase [bacterium]